jgi:2-methylcitrate dehydratase PrpD
MTFEQLPPEVVAGGKNFILDTLACCAAGARTEPVNAIVAAISALGGPENGPASLWAREGSASVDRAALVNATSAHALELDDFGGCGHSGAVVIPSVLAAGEQVGASGADVLLAIVAGYDVAARVLEGAGGYRRHNDLGWHSSGTCGSFGSAAGVAKLLGLDVEGFVSALGIAGTFTGGTWAFLTDGAMTKRFHPGKAAETGTAAAYLARSGMSGPRHVLDAEWGGFFSTYAPTISEPALTLLGLGREFRILRSGMKPYACCRTIHAPIDSLFALLDHFGVKIDAVERIIVHGNVQTMRQFDRMELESLLDAQFSMQFCLAVAAARRDLGLSQFEQWSQIPTDIASLMTRVVLVADRSLGPTEYAAVELLLHDGRSAERQVQFAKGHPDNPLSEAEVEAKARSLLAPAIGDAATDKLVVSVKNLEKVADIRSITDLLRICASQSPSLHA